MAQSKLEILLNAKNNASPQIKAVSSDLGLINKAAGAAAGGLAALGAAASVGAIAKMGYEAAIAASEFNTLKSNMDSLAQGVGQSSDSMLASMRSASMGMISDTKLVGSANRAMLLGVADSADEMASLLEVAIKRGAAMGLTAEQAFDDLVTGIGRMSPMILDNLGIVTGGQAVFDAYAESIGKAADALSDAEKKQALLNSVLASSAGMATHIDATAQAQQSLAASAANLQVALGQLFAPAVASGANALADGIDRIVEALRQANLIEFSDTTQELERQVELAKSIEAEIAKARSSPLYGGDGKFIKNRIAALEHVQAKITELRAEISNASIQMDADLYSVVPTAEDLARSLQTVATSAQASAEGAFAAGNAWGSVIGIFASAAAEARNLAISMATNRLEGVASSIFSSGGADAAIKFLDNSVYLVDQQVAAWEQAGYSAGQINDVLLPGYVSQLSEASRQTTKIAGGTATVNSEYSKLQSTISGIINSATGPVAGVNAEDFLPREDAVNENARRLADIMVNGLKGQEWLDEFKAEVPDIYNAIAESGDPQGAAARILKDFQDGLVPSLIDKDKAKELAKRALLGDRNASQLAEEIAGELAAEMGISIAKARAAATAAVGGTSAASAISAADGPVSANMVAKITSVDTTSITFEPLSMSAKITSVDHGALLDILSADYSVSIESKLGYPDVSELAFVPGVGEDKLKLGSEIGSVDSSKLSEVPSVGLSAFFQTVDASGLVAIRENLAPVPLTAKIAELNEGKLISMGGIAYPLQLGATIASVNEGALISMGGIAYPLQMTASITPTLKVESNQPYVWSLMINQAWAENQTAPFTVSPALTVPDEETMATFGDAVGMSMATSVGNSFATAFSEQSLGTRMAIALMVEISENASKFEASGTRAAQLWGPAFLAELEKNIPAGLVNILSGEVWEHIQNAFAWQDQLQGANRELP